MRQWWSGKIAGGISLATVVSFGAPLPAQSPGSIAAAEPAVVSNPAAAARLFRSLQAGLDHIAGEVLVRFKNGTDPDSQSSVLSQVFGRGGNARARWIGDVLSVEFDEPLEVASVVERFSRDERVEYAQPNYLRQLHATSNDTLFSQQWHMNLINMPQAWDINNGSRAEVLIAVLDSGLTTAYGSFVFRIWDARRFGLYAVPFAPAADFDHSRVREGADFSPLGTWRTPSGQPLFVDFDGHGTHVGGTIVQQTNNAFGYAGVAHAATLLPVKVCFAPWDMQLWAGFNDIAGFFDLEGCSDASIIQGIRYAADQGAKVINLSVRGLGAAPAVLDAISYAVTRGAFIAVSAGNAAMSGNPTQYPAAYGPDVAGMVAVAAVDRSLRRAFYSSFGSYLEIAGPGGDCSGCPDAVWQVGPNRSDLSLALVAPRADRYVQYGISGTSMASPHVAGVAALLYSQGVRNPAAIEAAIKRFARDLGESGAITSTAPALLMPALRYAGWD